MLLDFSAMQYNDRFTFIRSLAAVFPGAMIAFQWVHGVFLLALGIGLTWGIGWLLLHRYPHLKSLIHTLLVTLIACYVFSVYSRFILTLEAWPSFFLAFYRIFIDAIPLAFVSFIITLPAWLVYWLADYWTHRLLRASLDKNR